LTLSGCRAAWDGIRNRPSEFSAAATSIRAAADRFNQGQPDRPVALKIGIHHGTAIAIMPNDEPDYFGQTVNIAAPVQTMADAQEICVTEEVMAYPGVQALLANYHTQPVTAGFQGVGRLMPVIRVGGHLAG
jgi:class 3 adenylate cyclase